MNSPPRDRSMYQQGYPGMSTTFTPVASQPQPTLFRTPATPGLGASQSQSQTPGQPQGVLPSRLFGSTMNPTGRFGGDAYGFHTPARGGIATPYRRHGVQDVDSGNTGFAGASSTGNWYVERYCNCHARRGAQTSGAGLHVSQLSNDNQQKQTMEMPAVCSLRCMMVMVADC